MTPTLHPTLAGLLRAVCADPADDEVRLVLADWYEENGQEERGAFIRVQVEIAKLNRELGDEEECDEPTCDCKRRATLRRRERELAQRHAQSWLWQELGGDGRVATSPTSLLVPPGLKGNAIDCSWHRGFVAFVSSTVEFWCGRECRSCYWRTNEGIIMKWCPDCHGTGRVNAHGTAIVLAAPLERVTLSDRRPLIARHGEYGWFRRVRNSEISGEESELPVDLWKLLPGGFNRRDSLRGAGTWRDYPSEADAQSALSHAALAWARQQAGLPVLPV